jgi:hypothetical protein
MKEKIISQLKAKYPGVNLSKARLDAIADKLSPKITEESQIDAKLDELNEIFPFADIAKQDDRVRTLEAKTKEPPKPADTNQQNQQPSADQPPADDTPAWAKALMEEVRTLKTEKQQQTIQAKLNEKLKGVPPVFFKGRIPDSEDKIETVAAEILADYTAFQQDSINAGLETGKRPATGGASADTSKQAVIKDIENWTPQGKVAKEAAAK